MDLFVAILASLCLAALSGPLVSGECNVYYQCEGGECRRATSCSPGQVSSFTYAYPAVSTCRELARIHGIYDSGTYNVKPDDDAPSYKLHCTYTATEAVTEVWHDSMAEIEGDSCEPLGCYVRNVQYELDMEIIKGIVEKSAECRQHLKARCKGMMVAGHARWRSRTGEQINYWGGGNEDNYCACSLTDACDKPALPCNCNSNNSSTILVDEGYLKDKTKLPVTQLSLSDLGADLERGWHTLGKLECWGSGKGESKPQI